MTESASNILNDLKTLYRGVPILTLAQTALWDDPVKALFKGLLDAHAHDTRLILGVMDTDYFSRLPRPPGGAPPFDVLPHSEVSTRDLWAAVGEMSCLLGAETPLPLDRLAALGVNACKAATAAHLPADEFLDSLTEAWGWRGIAQTQGRRVLAGDVPLRELAEPLSRQVGWAIEETARVAGRDPGPYAAHLKDFVDGFTRRHPDGNLADLYLTLLPGLYATLLGYEPERLELSRSSELLRFNHRTARRKRFRPLDLFLDPATAALARHHYNLAVHESGIATLDRFGDFAVPFDLAVPGRGRGTLHLAPNEIRVDTDDPIVIPLDAPITERRQLSMLLERHLGPRVALLGKAVALITMLAGEYIFLFNETGSPYVRNSCRWNELLGADGLGLPLYPILRLGVHPWDTMCAAGGTLALPPHMHPFFGREEIDATGFEAGWREAMRSAGETLETIGRLHRPAEWIDHLASLDPAWVERATEYRSLMAARAERGRTIAGLNREAREKFAEIRTVRTRVNVMEVEKGRHFRERIQPLRDQLWNARRGSSEGILDLEDALAEAVAERARREQEIETLRAGTRPLEERRAALAEERKSLLNDPEAAARAERLAALENLAEWEKARRARDAWMTAQALDHTECRPTAWWFPVVDPSGAWFQAVARTAEFRWQSLMGGACAEPVPEDPITKAVVTI